MYDRLAQGAAAGRAGAFVHGVLGLPGLKGRSWRKGFRVKVRAVSEKLDPELKTQMCPPAYLKTAMAFGPGKRAGLQVSAGKRLSGKGLADPQNASLIWIRICRGYPVQGGQGFHEIFAGSKVSDSG